VAVKVIKGRAPKRSTSASKAAKVSLTKTGKSKTPAKKEMHSVETWEKKSAGSWVAGQSMGLNPGDPRAISRRRHTAKFRARGKHVIRPRIKKVNRIDMTAK
jgi:hypothetical protein